MPILNSCLCFDLRQGTIASGIYSIIGAFVAVGLAIWFIVVSTTKTQFDDTDEVKTAKLILQITAAIYFIGAAITIVVSAVLIAGARKNNRRMLMPWMVLTGIGIAVQIPRTVWGVAKGSMGMVEVTISAIQILIYILLFLVVYSYYKSLEPGMIPVQITQPGYNVQYQQPMYVPVNTNPNNPPHYTAKT